MTRTATRYESGTALILGRRFITWKAVRSRYDSVTRTAATGGMTRTAGSCNLGRAARAPGGEVSESDWDSNGGRRQSGMRESDFSKLCQSDSDDGEV